MNKKIFITGGAGFIGSNICLHHLKKGDKVVVYDNLTRPGTEKNLRLLKSLKNKSLKFIRGDIRNLSVLKKAMKGSDLIYHMAAQVAVTTSLINPREDFEINALGTLNVLEAMKKDSPGATLIYASTNKVYGSLDNPKIAKKGVSEMQNLDFHSPYGCSKGAGDQYVSDYGRVYGLKTIVFRQSCIYGEMQRGNEDQGWVAHFIKKFLLGEKIVIYGDGNQVRDILYISDLLNAYDKSAISVKKGHPLVYNIGGGVINSLSLLDLVSYLEIFFDKKIKIVFKKPREGDQKIYISDNSKISKELGWKPLVSKDIGINKLILWLKNND